MGRKQLTRTSLRQRRWGPEPLPLETRDVDAVRTKRRELVTGRTDPMTGTPPTDEHGSGGLW
jgi:hypothetical protein